MEALGVSGVLHGCPHCVGLHGGSCCQCNGARLVTFEVARANVAWVWAYDFCSCRACVQLGRQLASIAAAVTAQVQELVATVDHVVAPDPDGTFRGHFRRRCAYCGHRRLDDAFGVHCSDLCRRRARAVDARRARLTASASG